MIAMATFFIGRVSTSNDKGEKMGIILQSIRGLQEMLERVEKNTNRNIDRVEGTADAFHTRFDDHVREME